MKQPKKLIEVAMPIKEISAESVRDKSIRHGHISTLHLWWARRPLPVCRAVVFASLVPDPLDENCPQQFRDAVEILLGSAKRPLDELGIDSNAYKPYDDIPYTAAVDKMEDNLRNRLLMFIGKYSNEFVVNEKAGKSTVSGKQLSDYSLIKWENRNNEAIINKARKLIWVSHNCKNADVNVSISDLIESFDSHYGAIRQGENELYSITDRQIHTKQVIKATQNLTDAIKAFWSKMPKVFDPFAGGGAIPLEAARLGCQSYGNDINPVAHIIQKGSLEFPQKYGKPITYTKHEFERNYGREELLHWCTENTKHPDAEGLEIRIPNRLSFDIEFYAKKLLAAAKEKIGHLYSMGQNGNKLIAYYWVRVGTCSNPSCKAEIPLLRQFTLANTKTKQVYLCPIIKGKEIDFEIKKGKSVLNGWVNKNNLTCPICGSVTQASIIKQEFETKGLKERLIAVIEDSKDGGRFYRLPVLHEATVEAPESEMPNELLPKALTGGSIMSWGYTKWGQMFSKRQLYMLNTLVVVHNQICLELEVQTPGYKEAISTYLAILIDRVATISTSLGRWDVTREGIQSPFSKQAIPMMFDFPEGNILGDGMGSLINQLDWVIRYIESESFHSFSTELKNASSGDKFQFTDKYLTAVVTDPPYYDAIAYADLSDFFYLWLKRTLGAVFPLNFATPQTPKTEECTALKHHHNDSKDGAKHHFERKLTEIFDAIEHQTSDIVSIMFAHQSTEAWTTLCNAVLDARMNITGSWPVDTEMANRSLGLSSAALESSVTVSCRPSYRNGHGDYKEVKRAIEQTVKKEVDELYRLGFRGADLLTACFGQAVSEFGKYQKVEKADGSEVKVAELLEMARESAFNALLKGFDGDDYTKFYIGWLQLYGFIESDFDDAAKFSRVGLSINVSDLFSQHILMQNGNKQTLGSFEQRLNADRNLGEKTHDYLINQVHRAMALYKGTNRTALLQYIGTMAASPESNFWRVITSLCEVVPSGSEDYKQATGLLTNKESLLRESKTALIPATEQAKLFE